MVQNVLKKMKGVTTGKRKNMVGGREGVKWEIYSEWFWALLVGGANSSNGWCFSGKKWCCCGKMAFLVGKLAFLVFVPQLLAYRIRLFTYILGEEGVNKIKAPRPSSWNNCLDLAYVPTFGSTRRSKTQNLAYLVVSPQFGDQLRHCGALSQFF